MPGVAVERHGEVFAHWRDAIDRGVLEPPFSVTHVDAHADLGLGDSGYIYLLTELVFQPLEARRFPRVGHDAFTDGNWLSFAVACRWISDLMYVYNTGDERPDDLMVCVMEGFDTRAANIQLAGLTQEQLRNALHDRDWEAVHLEPKVPVRGSSLGAIRVSRPPDFISLARSPEFTPAESDALYDLIRECFVRKFEVRAAKMRRNVWKGPGLFEVRPTRASAVGITATPCNDESVAAAHRGLFKSRCVVASSRRSSLARFASRRRHVTRSALTRTATRNKVHSHARPRESRAHRCDSHRQRRARQHQVGSAEGRVGRRHMCGGSGSSRSSSLSMSHTLGARRTGSERPNSPINQAIRSQIVTPPAPTNFASCAWISGLATSRTRTGPRSPARPHLGSTEARRIVAAEVSAAEHRAEALARSRIHDVSSVLRYRH